LRLMSRRSEALCVNKHVALLRCLASSIYIVIRVEDAYDDSSWALFALCSKFIEDRSTCETFQ